MYQRTADPKQIWAFYAPFATVEEDTTGKCFQEVTARKKGEEIYLAILLEKRGGYPFPHVLPPQGLGICTVLSR